MEFLSNASSSSSEDPFRPSIFELVAQDKMSDLLKPALRYALSVYAHRYPRQLLPIVNNLEHVYALLMLIVERSYLLEWNGSLAENFYGLRRVPTSVGGPLKRKSKRLGAAQLWGSLVFLVGLPYAKSLVDEYYESIAGGAERLFGRRIATTPSDTSNQDRNLLDTIKTSAKRGFKSSYPYIKSLYNAALLYYQVAYMYGFSEYYTPWLAILGLRIRRMSQHDYREHEEKQQSLSQLNPSSLSTLSKFQFIKQIINMTASKSLSALKIALPMSIFFFKFLEWWYASEYHKQIGIQPIPPPPALIPVK
ncbi:ubiquitin-protein ligase peroxin 12 [Blyttiomyces sp. JEL0837]|nr:ubiquitin-protein ligase peroxin 12 [Blyttiomyces sp. JEL0837]